MTEADRRDGTATRWATAALTAGALLLGRTTSAEAAPPAAQHGCGTHAGTRHGLERLVQSYDLPGVSIQIDDPKCGRWFGTSGVADIDSGRIMRADDRIRIGSVTKTFTATVVLQLAAEGRLSLDAPIDRYVPGLINRNGYDGRRITVRQLLQHTSGLADHTDSPTFDDFSTWRFRHFAPHQLVNLALDMLHPTTTWSYSTTNYIVAGMIVDRVTGHSIESEVARRIIRPLGLRDTYWPGDSTRIRGPHPRGYDPRTNGGKVRQVDVTALNTTFGGAGGALISTTGDMNTFFGALLGGRLLPKAQLKDMERTVKADPDRVWPGARYGLGLITTPLRCGGTWTGHAGSIPGFRALDGESSAGRRVAIAANALPSSLAGEKAFRNLVQTAFCENAAPTDTTTIGEN